MSNGALNTFLKTAAQDEAMREQLLRIGRDETTNSQADLQRFATARGYTVTEEDIRSAAHDAASMLDDTQLDQVVGGVDLFDAAIAVDKINPVSWILYGVGLRKSRPGGPYR